jgi:hypothetical protein
MDLVWPNTMALNVAEHRPRWPLWQIGVLVALGLLAAACGDSDDARPTVPTRQVTTTQSDTPFCVEAIRFNTFIDENGAALIEPGRARLYMTESMERLGVLASLAPGAVSNDIDVIIGAYVELDQTLADVDYDLLQVDDVAFESEAGTDASLELDAFLFENCGFDPLAALPFEGEAPEVFSDQEFSEIVDGDVDSDLVELLVEQFVLEFGLDEAAALCLASSMNSDSVTAIASGGVVTDEVAEEFAATLKGCNIDATSLLG